MNPQKNVFAKYVIHTTTLRIGTLPDSGPREARGTAGHVAQVDKLQLKYNRCSGPRTPRDLTTRPHKTILGSLLACDPWVLLLASCPTQNLASVFQTTDLGELAKRASVPRLAYTMCACVGPRASPDSLRPPFLTLDPISPEWICGEGARWWVPQPGECCS
jgi:hypothetical protein